MAERMCDCGHPMHKGKCLHLVAGGRVRCECLDGNEAIPDPISDRERVAELEAALAELIREAETVGDWIVEYRWAQEFNEALDHARAALTPKTEEERNG